MSAVCLAVRQHAQTAFPERSLVQLRWTAGVANRRGPAVIKEFTHDRIIKYDVLYINPEKG